nr:hypothetical protein [Dactylosporangium matsuzakiense]
MARSLIGRGRPRSAHRPITCPGPTPRSARRLAERRAAAWTCSCGNWTALLMTAGSVAVATSAGDCVKVVAGPAAGPLRSAEVSNSGWWTGPVSNSGWWAGADGRRATSFGS